MSYNSCVVYPAVSIPNGVDTNGNPQFIEENSLLYVKLLAKLDKNRPFVNLLYANYLASDLADKMDQAGIARNRQGEHNAEDVLRFINWEDIEKEILALPSIEKVAGFVDNNLQRVDFTDALNALQKANDFNINHKNFVARVIQHGDVYNIIASQKDSRTHTYGDSVSTTLQVWQVYEQAFNTIGIDINNMPPELSNRFNALNINLAQSLKNLTRMSIDYMYKQDAWTLFALSPNSRHVQNAINAFGSMEAAAQALDDINHGATGFTAAQKILLARAINDAKNVQGLDLDALIAQVSQMSQNIQNTSPEKAIADELHRLNKKYNIDINEIHRTSNKIYKLSDAVAESIFVLYRQIRTLEREKGDSAESRKKELMLNNFMKELNAKKYYSGILQFLKEASTQVAGIDTMLQNIPQTGTEMEKAFATAKILQNIRSLYTQYYDLASALANENLTIDETISQTDIDNFRQLSKSIKDFFDKKQELLDHLIENTMVTLMQQTIGNTTADGQSIINAVSMAASDSSKWDFLYSMGRASDPLAASVGTIIRNAQTSRDAKITAIEKRVARLTDRLYKSGLDSAFMYEDDGHITSDIDWNMYENARNMKYNDLRKAGLRDYDLKQAIEAWEEQNTEDRVVDNTNGRTERVPDYRYRKLHNFQEGWSQEQIDYYNEMMQLKGEIGSMLPAYAQHQYLPPQVRRKFLDAIENSSNLHDVFNAVKNKVQDLYTVREDDEMYSNNGVIGGIEFTVAEGDFNNNKLRQIPIFFVNKVAQGELLHNFSTGLMFLAGTAVNYEAMHDIVDTVEFMSDFADSRPTREEMLEGEIVANKFLRMVKDLNKRSKNTNTHALLQGFISQHIYGEKTSEWERKNPRLSKIFNNIISYSSFKALSTNIKGAFNNYVMGEAQMFIEAGCGEFYGIKDFLWAHSKLFGDSGVMGEISELLTNNTSHKSSLFAEMFDPLNENFANKSHKQYHKSMFRQVLGHDCSFIGYSSGEYLIHYVNMYSILHNQKVLLNGKKIPLYDAFEVTNKQDGNSELRLKQGVTDLDGNPITNEFIEKVRGRIRYVNQTCHGSMNAEDKGIIHQYLLGRAIMNLRQWMVEHYSRRFRKRHFDSSLGEWREGYWTSYVNAIYNDDVKDAWKKGNKVDAMAMFMRDFYTFTFRAKSQWSNLSEMEKYNINRVRTEMVMFVALLGLSFALGDPDKHKKEFWRRWWIYQVRRMLMETEASLPTPLIIDSGLSILNSPIAAVDTMNSLLYTFYGLTNGDLFTEIQSGPHKGENKYWRNVKKHVFPFFKDWEQMENMDTNDNIFKIFEHSPSNH